MPFTVPTTHITRCSRDEIVDKGAVVGTVEDTTQVETRPGRLAE
jgi:hypothetical protein